MKKLVLTALAISGLTAAAFGQGTVNWTGVAGSFVGSTNSTVISSFSHVGAGQATGEGSSGVTTGNTLANNTALGYSGYYYALLTSASANAAPTTFAGLGAWSDTGLTATNATAANGRISQVNPVQNATANNFPAGSTQGLILVGWSANLGSTWAAALANMQNDAFVAALSSKAYFGVSSFGSLAIGSANPGISVFGTNPGQINNGSGTPMVMNVLAVPEPGTLALAALGGASLLLFRRKK